MSVGNGDSSIDYADKEQFLSEYDESIHWTAGPGPVFMGESTTEDTGEAGTVIAPISSPVLELAPRLLYYTTSFQEIEEDAQNPWAAYNGTTTLQVADQQVWGAAYVNELILRDSDSDGSASTGDYGKSGSGLDERLYAQQDANYNVTRV